MKTIRFGILSALLFALASSLVHAGDVTYAYTEVNRHPSKFQIAYETLVAAPEWNPASEPAKFDLPQFIKKAEAWVRAEAGVDPRNKLVTLAVDIEKFEPPFPEELTESQQKQLSTRNIWILKIDFQMRGPGPGVAVEKLYMAMLLDGTIGKPVRNR